MAIFTNLKGERVQTSKNKDGSINRKVLSTGNPVTASHSGSKDKKTGINTVDAYNNSIGYSADGKKKITSSNSVLSDKNKMDARLQAGAALTSSGSDYGQGNVFNNQQQGYMNMNLMNEQQNQYLQDQQGMIDMVSLKFDAALRRSNRQYDNLLSDLETNLNNDMAMATQQAAALNPYSESAGAMTARNFKGAIQTEYQKQALRVQQQAEAAEEALRLGEMEAYMGITNSMKESQRNFQKQMMEFMLGAQQEFNANQQWQSEFGLKQQAFNLEASQVHEGDFMNFIDTFGADPNFQAEIGNYFQTGQITESLVPLLEKGRMAGYSTPEEILAVASYETQNQAKLRIDQEQFNAQLNLGWYNAQTSRMSADTARTKAMQDALAANQGISNSRAQRANDIMEFGMRAFDILKQGDTRATGLSATASLWLPGASTQADQLQGYYDSILSNVSLTEMQRLKDESATGSTGFGQQSNAEFQALRDAMGVLSAQNNVVVQQENLARILAAQHNIIQLHAAATGQLNQSPALLSKEDILREVGVYGLQGTTGSGVTWKVVE